MRYFSRHLDYGNVAVNNVDAGIINAPYGGWKQSGIGVEHGREGLARVPQPQACPPLFRREPARPPRRREHVMTGAFLGIDIGTSSCKALLLGTDGEVIGTETVPYDFDQPREGWSEQDPAVWIDGAAEAVRALLARAPVEVLCVGLSGQMHGMTALDAAHEVLRPAILWNDQRNARECEEITELAGGLAGLTRLVNNRMLPGFTGGKIRWFAKHEPELFAKTRLILNPKDYVRLVMTGETATEVSDASGTGLFDVAARAGGRGICSTWRASTGIFCRPPTSPPR